MMGCILLTLALAERQVLLIYKCEQMSQILFQLTRLHCERFHYGVSFHITTRIDCLGSCSIAVTDQWYVFSDESTLAWFRS